MIDASQSDRFLQDRGFDHNRPDLLLMVERRGMEWKPQASDDAALFVRRSSWLAKAAGVATAIAVPIVPLKLDAEGIAWPRAGTISHPGDKETTVNVRRFIVAERSQLRRELAPKKR